MLELFQGLAASQFVQSLALATILGFAGRIATAKSKIVWAVSHQHVYLMPRLDDAGSFPVRTQQIWVQNAGRLPAEQLEIILNFPPQHFEIWSPRNFEQTRISENRLVIKVPALAGSEFFTLSMLDTFQDLPVVLNVRWKDGVAKSIPMGPQRIYPTWIIAGLWSLILVGVTALIYLGLDALS